MLRNTNQGSDMRFKILALCALSGGLASAAAQALQSPGAEPIETQVLPREYDVDLDLSPLDHLPASCYVAPPQDLPAAVVSRGERQRWTLPMTVDGALQLSASGRSFRLGDAGEVVLPAALEDVDGRYTSHSMRVAGGRKKSRLARFQSSVVTFDETDGTLTGSLELTAFRGCASARCATPVVLCSAQLPFVAHPRAPAFLATRR